MTAAPSNAPKVSVIMRSKNSDWVIGQSLGALFSQSFRDFELIVVDSGSKDRTLEIVRQYPSKLIEIEASSYFPGAVLNMAVEHAKSDLFVYLNSDGVLLSPESLARLVAAFDGPGVHAAFGRQLPRPDAHTWVRRDYAASFPERGPAPPWMKMSLVFSAMRRSAWEEHPFYVDAWASEDTEWGTWAAANGRKVEYVADAICMHSHNYTLREIYGRRFVEGEADAFIYRDRASIASESAAFARAIARDAVVHLSAWDFDGLVKAPARRAVFHWAYYKGHCHGEARIARGDTDASAGQQIVLTRHSEAGR